MESQPIAIRRLLALLAVTALLGGCLGGATPAPRYYVLNPVVAEPAVPDPAAAELTVKLLELRLPQYLERPQIVTRSEANRLELAEYHQWGGNLRKNMVRVLVRNLSRALGTPLVSGPPLRTGLAADYLVELEVTEFERRPDGRVGLAAWWRLMGGGGEGTLEARVSELHSAPLPPEAGFETTVATMAEVYGELAREIATAIRRHAGGGAAG